MIAVLISARFVDCDRDANEEAANGTQVVDKVEPTEELTNSIADVISYEGEISVSCF